jgi:DNA-binding NarL/FixJ family response regulator
VSLGAIVALQKKYTWAVWLWGKAKALYKTRDEFCKLAPYEWLLTILGTNLFYSQVVETVRTQLGEQTFTAIWNEGETMTLEQLLVEPKSQVITTPCVSKKTPGTYSDRLTPRERDVLRLLAQGMSSAQIAKQLVISLVTVNSHVRTIYSKLGVSSRSAATRYAMEHQLV